jgi:hypothetical protein
VIAGFDLDGDRDYTWRTDGVAGRSAGVARGVWDAEVAGSNPVAPTILVLLSVFRITARKVKILSDLSQDEPVTLNRG